MMMRTKLSLCTATLLTLGLLSQVAVSKSLTKEEETQLKQELQQLQKKAEEAEKKQKKESDPKEKKKDHERYQILQAKLDEYTATKPCETAAQCKVISLGNKPCGGAWGYEIYSTQTVSEADISKVISEMDAIKKKNMRKGMVSTCEHIPEPIAQCVENQCTAQKKMLLY